MFDSAEGNDPFNGGPSEHDRGIALGPVLGTLVLDALNTWAGSLDGSAQPVCQKCVRSAVTAFIVADVIKRKRALGTPENALTYEVEMIVRHAFAYASSH